MRPTNNARKEAVACGQSDHSTLYISLELSRSTWLVTSLSPCSDKMSKQTIAAGDASKLLALLTRLRERAEQLVGGSLNVAVIQEAGLDGFWVHRSLEANDIESHVVDPASVAVSRRRRRAKTDMIDGETLLRTLLACQALKRKRTFSDLPRGAAFWYENKSPLIRGARTATLVSRLAFRSRSSLK
jgi:transposase